MQVWLAAMPPGAGAGQLGPAEQLGQLRAAEEATERAGARWVRRSARTLFPHGTARTVRALAAASSGCLVRRGLCAPTTVLRPSLGRGRETLYVWLSLKMHGDGGRGSAAFLTKAAQFSRLFRPRSSLNCMRCGRSVLEPRRRGRPVRDGRWCRTNFRLCAAQSAEARAAGFAQQGAPSNTEQHRKGFEPGDRCWLCMFCGHLHVRVSKNRENRDLITRSLE